MPGLSQRSVWNRLLSSLSDESFDRLSPHLEEVDLPLRMDLVAPDVPTPYVFFLESGLGSIIAGAADDEQHIEVGHIGREGMSAFHVILADDRTPNRTFMQVAGSALRMPAALFQKALNDDLALRTVLLRYVHSYQIQLSHSALANGRYAMSERLARWLLMCHDRLDGDDMAVTHEFLSLMLGVRRSGVTNEIHILEGFGVIKATRGRVQVLDRAHLEEIAGGCYGVPEREYERLIGSPLHVS